ncbi:MAG: hypothetical protein HY744_03345 [Deltaproteobacteria bacterium]|nr:hypothetical protein [Deltaproteobacteria bacterium]
MLSPDVALDGFSGTDWQRLVELLGAARSPQQAGASVVAVRDGDRLRKLLHTSRGRLPLGDAATGASPSAAEIARRHGAARAVVIESGALDDVLEGFGARARHDQDLTDQILLLFGLWREQVRLGRIEPWPPWPGVLLLPGRAWIERGLDLVVPRDQTALLALLDGRQLWTSLALTRGERGIEHIWGPEPLRAQIGALSGNLRADARLVARAATQLAGPLSLCVAVRPERLRSLLAHPAPGRWAGAALAGELVLRPARAGALLLAVLAATRAAATVWTLLGALRRGVSH